MVYIYFSNFWPILWNPFAKVDGSMPECAQVCALHMRLESTALGDAKENRNGRRLSPYRRKPKKWYYVTHFFWLTLANPVTDGSKHMRQLDRGEIKLFNIRCLYASIFNSF